MAALLWHPLTSHKPSMRVKASWAPPICMIKWQWAQDFATSGKFIECDACVMCTSHCFKAFFYNLGPLNSFCHLFPKPWWRVDLDVPYSPLLNTLTSGKTVSTISQCKKRLLWWRLTAHLMLLRQDLYVTQVGFILGYPVSVLRLQLPTATAA